jgi:hypothetical protein
MKQIVLVLICLCGITVALFGDDLKFTSTFRDLSECTFSSTGNNPYFPIHPGSKWVYEGKEIKKMCV